MKTNRILAIVMALTLLFTQMSFITVSAAETAEKTSLYSETELASFGRKYEMLTDLGVFPVMDKKAEDTLSRSDFAGIVAQLLGTALYDASLFENTYIDVEALTNNASAIISLKKMGVMDGVNHVEFKPDKKVTYAQAVKTIVSALGYRELAEVSGGYYQGYLKKAIDLGLLKSGAANYDRELTVYDAVSLVTESLDVKVPEMISVSSDRTTYSKYSGHNLLAAYHGILEVNGIMTDNGQTALNSETTAVFGNAIIGGIRMMGIDEKFTGLIGRNVVAYYKPSENNKLYHVYADEAKNKILVIDAYDLVTDSAKFTKSNIVYKKANGKSENAKISYYADFIYNGAAFPNFMTDTLKIPTGKLTLIDADNDKVYETIIAETYYDYLVKTADSLTGTFYSSYGEPIYFNKYKVLHFYDAEGKEVELADIKYETLLTVYQSKDYTKLIAYVSNTRTSMVIDSITENEDGSLYVAAGEASYRIGETYKAAMNDPATSLKVPETGAKYDVFINVYGEAAFFADTQNRAEYAYLLAAGNETNDKLGGVKPAVKVVNEQGDSVVVRAAKNFVVIDSKGTHENDANAVLNSSDIRSSSTGKLIPQLIRIKVNSKGEFTQLEYDNSVITEAEAPYGFNEEKFQKLYAGSMSTYGGYSSKNLGSSGYILDKNTKIFLVETPGSYSTTDETKVKVIPYSKFQLVTLTGAIYDADQNWSVGAMVCATSSTSFDDRTFTVISSKTIIDEFGEERTQVKGYWKNNIWTFREHTPGVFADAIAAFNTSDGLDADGNVKPGFNVYSGLKPGDVFVIQFDNDKQEIVKAMMVMSPLRSEENVRKGFGPYSATAYASTTWGRVVGYPVSGTDGTIGILSNNAYFVETITSATYVTVFDTRTGEITRGDRLKLPTIGSADKSGKIDAGDGSIMIYGWRQRNHLCDILIVLK